MAFFIKCHYTTPFAAITVLIRPQVYAQTQTLEKTDREACSHAVMKTHTYAITSRCVMLTVLNVGDMGGREGGERELGGLTMRRGREEK